MTLMIKLGSAPRLGRVTATVCGLMLGVLLCGCQTPVKSADLAAFSAATTAIAQQASTSLSDSNALARQVSIERFIQSGAVGLSESQFATAISPADINAWQEALDGLQQYGNGVSVLTDTARNAAMGEALLHLGQQVRAQSIAARISPVATAGFVSLGDAIAQAASERRARAILTATNPAIQKIIAGLADAIGASDDQGLRGTVKTNWTASFGDVRIAYATAAAQHDTATQRSLIAQYLVGLDHRDAQLKTLAGLRASLLGLGAAHAAAAEGRPESIPILLEAIVARAGEAERLYDALAADAGKPNAFSSPRGQP